MSGTKPETHHVVTVHLVVAGSNEAEPTTKYDTVAAIADGVSAFLGDGEATGFLLDWGYAKGGLPEQAIPVTGDDYNEGDFYRIANLPGPNAKPRPTVSEAADKLVRWVQDASLECGEWDSDDERHTYEELHGESLKALEKLRAYIADLEARVAAPTSAYEPEEEAPSADTREVAQ